MGDGGKLAAVSMAPPARTQTDKQRRKHAMLLPGYTDVNLLSNSRL